MAIFEYLKLNEEYNMINHAEARNEYIQNDFIDNLFKL